MNLNVVSLTATITRAGKVKKRTFDDMYECYYYLEIGGYYTLDEDGPESEDGKRIADLCPVRAKLLTRKPVSLTPGQLVMVTGKLYSYKMNINNKLFYTIGILAKYMQIISPLSRERRAKVINQYTKPIPISPNSVLSLASS